MNQEQAGMIMLALMVVSLGLAWWGWRNRQKRYQPLTDALTWSEPSGETSYSCRALYVATTEADKPMDRVAAGPLAYRSKVHLAIYPVGLSVVFPGKKALLLPSSTGLSAGQATWTIDRVVETGGLVMLRWTLGNKSVDSYFRIVDGDQSAFISGINALVKGSK
jgi:hypothetical protein